MDGSSELLAALVAKQLAIQSKPRPSGADADGCEGYEYAYEEEEEEYDEDDDDDECRTDFPCPYCSDDFDIVELCFHLETEHYNLAARNGVCPVCAVTVSSDLVAHITKEHGNLIKIQVKLKYTKDQDASTLSLLKKAFYEEHMRTLIGSSHPSSPPDMKPDPLLLSFMCNTDREYSNVQPTQSATPSLVEESSEGYLLKRNPELAPPLSDKEQEERERRSQFVQGLFCSTFLMGDF